MLVMSKTTPDVTAGPDPFGIFEVMVVGGPEKPVGPVAPTAPVGPVGPPDGPVGPVIAVTTPVPALPLLSIQPLVMTMRVFVLASNRIRICDTVFVNTRTPAKEPTPEGAPWEVIAVTP